MPKSTKEEKFRWIKPILDKEISIKDMVKICPFSERSLKYWLTGYKKYGMDGLELKSTRPKTNPKETPIRIKEREIGKKIQIKKFVTKIPTFDVGIYLKRVLGAADFKMNMTTAGIAAYADIADYLALNNMSARADNIIFGNKLVIFSYKDTPQAVVIESSDVVATYKSVFEILWKSV